MSFRVHILLALALAGVLPVTLLGALSYRANRQELTATLGRLQTQGAQDLARLTAQHVLGGVDSLTLAAKALPLERLATDEVAPVLQLPFRQLDQLTLLALVDGAGRALAPAVYERTPGQGRPPMDDAALAAFSARVPLGAAHTAGAAVGPPYRTPTGGARVALAVTAGTRLLIAELSLDALEERLEELAAGGGRALLLDARGEPLHAGPALSATERALVEEGARLGAPRARAVDGPDGQAELAAWAPVPELGWGVLVARPGEQAFAAPERVRRYTLYWALVALLATAAVGVVLSRAVTRPLDALTRAADQLAQGQRAAFVPEDAPGELGRLGAGFNRMARELERRDAELQGWNQELQRRVDAQTRQLREAQDQVERARRLAALGSLSAGMAHELNNPLTGVIGLASLLKEEVPPGPAHDTLALLGEQAQRMARVVHSLRQAAEREAQGPGRTFPPSLALEGALAQVAPALEARGVRLVRELSPRTPPVQGHPEQLQEVVGHLLQNALTAMPQGGTLTVGLEPVGAEAVRLWVRDTGRGIPARLRERIFDPFFTTKDEPGRVGLGLTVCHRIVESHHGRILLESEEGRGATFTVVLPAAGDAPHLV